MILWKDLKRVRIRLPGFLAIEVQLRLWLEQRFAGAFELWRAHVLRQGPNTQLPYIGGELDLSSVPPVIRLAWASTSSTCGSCCW